MGQPGIFVIVRHGKAVGKSDLLGPAVFIRQGGKRQSGQRAGKFGGQCLAFRRQRFCLGFVFGIGIAKLGDIVILHAIHAQAVPKMLLRQQFDLCDMLRSEVRRQFEDHRALIKLHIEQVGGIRCAPGIGRRGVDNLLGGAARGGEYR